MAPPNSVMASHRTLVFHQISVLLLTFAAYASFHASRKPPSIVKSVLTSELHLPNSTGWPPFNGPHGPHRLGELDLAFLASYSIGMYFSGHFGDRIDLRIFLAFGMFGSGLFTVLFGLGYWFRAHVLWYFLAVQIVCGLFQSIGWPCVVSIVGNWFGKSKRGLIMGIWNSHTSVGNVIGSIVASSVLEFGWGWSFLLPGLLIVVMGVMVLGFLTVRPEDVGLERPGSGIEMSDSVELGHVEKSEKVDPEEDGLLHHSLDSVNLNSSVQSVNLDSSDAIGFLDAWRLPGVAPYAFCLFFSKLVAYTFLYWLPFYIRHTAIAGVQPSHRTAGILSTIFDIGGMFGGILSGYISDKIDGRALTSIVFLLLSIPSLVFYRIFGGVSMSLNIGLMFLTGLLVNGPYSLITTAVAADIGTQTIMIGGGNSRALAMVAAIIDGTGSVGAAVGPLLAGYISTRGWDSMFSMLVVSVFVGSLFLIRISKNEIKGNLGMF